MEMGTDPRRIATFLVVGGAIGGAVGFCVHKIIEARKDNEHPYLDSMMYEEGVRSIARDNIVYPDHTNKPDLGEVYKNLQEEIERTNYSTIVSEIGYSAPETVDTSSLDTGLHIPKIHEEAMEMLENRVEEEEMIEETVDDYDEEYEAMTEEEAKALRRSQIRGTEEPEPVKIEPLTDEDVGVWQRISWDKYVNDIPFYLKRTASYFVPSDVLAGFDDDIDPVAEDDELYRRCWTLIHNEYFDDTGLYFMDAENSVAVEVVVLENENFLDSVAEMKHNK